MIRATSDAGVGSRRRCHGRRARWRHGVRRGRPSGTSSRIGTRCGECRPASRVPRTATTRSRWRSGRPTARDGGRRRTTRADRCSVRIGSMAVRSNGERIRFAERPRVRHRPGEERPLRDVPDPSAPVVERTPLVARARRELIEGRGGVVVAVGHGQRRAVAPSGTRTAGRAGRGRPARRARCRPARNTSSNTCGSVTSDGPMSNVYPSRSKVASLPPTTSLRSNTVTCGRVPATGSPPSSPPTPPPMTTTAPGRPCGDVIAAALRHGASLRRAVAAIGSMPTPPTIGDDRIAEVAGEPDRLHHAHVGVLPDERRRRRRPRVVGGREERFEQRHHAEPGDEPPEIVRRAGSRGTRRGVPTPSSPRRPSADRGTDPTPSAPPNRERCGSPASTWRRAQRARSRVRAGPARTRRAARWPGTWATCGRSARGVGVAAEREPGRRADPLDRGRSPRR